MKKPTKVKAWDIQLDGLEFSLSPAGGTYRLWRSKREALRRAREVNPDYNPKVIPVEIRFLK